VPVSKKRKPKRRISAPVRTSPANSSPTLAGGASPKKKLSRQQIIIYVVSIVMILSLAISYIVGNGRSSGVVPVSTPTVSTSQTAAPASSGTTEAQPTAEPTAAQ
jgi:hypothetical protein